MNIKLESVVFLMQVVMILVVFIYKNNLGHCFRYGFSPKNDSYISIMKLASKIGNLDFNNDFIQFDNHHELVEYMIKNPGMIETGIIFNDTLTYVIVANNTGEMDYSGLGYNEVYRNTYYPGLSTATQVYLINIDVNRLSYYIISFR